MMQATASVPPTPTVTVLAELQAHTAAGRLSRDNSVLRTPAAVIRVAHSGNWPHSPSDLPH